MESVEVSKASKISVPFRVEDLPLSQIGGVPPPMIVSLMQQKGQHVSQFCGFWRTPKKMLTSAACTKISKSFKGWPLNPFNFPCCWPCATCSIWKLKRIEKRRIVILTSERVIEYCNYPGVERFESYPVRDTLCIDSSLRNLAETCAPQDRKTYIRFKWKSDNPDDPYDESDEPNVNVWCSTEKEVDKIYKLFMSIKFSKLACPDPPEEPTVIVINNNNTPPLAVPFAESVQVTSSTTESVPVATSPRHRDANIDKILQLKDLVDAGALSPEEYAEQKRILLKNFALSPKGEI